MQEPSAKVCVLTQYGNQDSAAILMQGRALSIDHQDSAASSKRVDQLETPVTTLPDGDAIGRATSLEEIIATLAKRGCADLTSSIDVDACGKFAVAGGGFCDVYRGKLQTGGDIAIKSLRVYDGPEAESQKQKILKHAARELYQWSKLKHCNVLPLMGLTVFRGHISMVSEWMQNGNLSAYLRLNPQANQVHLCMDISSGLCYIHENNMVHGDLKAANVMVSSMGVAMITDFGNAQLRDLTIKFSNTTGFAVSPRWASPELLSDDGAPHVSKMSDIWAYGMTMLEVLTGKVPFDGLNDHQVYISVGVKRKHPARPKDLDDGLWSTMVSCWAPNSEDRLDIMRLNSILYEAYPDYESHRLRSGNGSKHLESMNNVIHRQFSGGSDSIATTVHTELFEHASYGSATTADPSHRHWQGQSSAVATLPEALLIQGPTQLNSPETSSFGPTSTNTGNQDHISSQDRIPQNRITTGDYIITNVSTGNRVVSLSGSSDSELVGVSSDGTETMAKFKEWSVLRIALGTYLIQSPRTLWVSHDTRPKKDSGVFVKLGFKEWRIKESQTKEHYTISPVGADLYWGLSADERGTPIVLRTGPNDSRNHWVFHSVHEGE